MRLDNLYHGCVILTEQYKLCQTRIGLSMLLLLYTRIYFPVIGQAIIILHETAAIGKLMNHGIHYVRHGFLTFTQQLAYTRQLDYVRILCVYFITTCIIYSIASLL